MTSFFSTKVFSKTRGNPPSWYLLAMGGYFPPRTRDLLGHPGPTPNPRETEASSTAVLSQNPGCDGSTPPPTAPLMDCVPELVSPGEGGGAAPPTPLRSSLPTQRALGSSEAGVCGPLQGRDSACQKPSDVAGKQAVSEVHWVSESHQSS